MTQLRRVMGIDHGEVRIGVALSDPLGIVARPHAIITHSTPEADYRALADMVRDESVAKIVIGLPTDAEGRIGYQAARVVSWARRLAEYVPVPISFWDESYSSVDASEVLQRAGKRRRREAPVGTGGVHVQVDHDGEDCESRGRPEVVPPAAVRSRWTSARYSRTSRSRCSFSSSANSRKMRLPSESSNRSP